jgi:hypothetical protein
VVFTDGRVPLCGLFVAENAEHLYIGEAIEGQIRNVGDHTRGRLFDLPRQEVRALALGSSQSLPNARKRSPVLLKDLMELHRLPIPKDGLGHDCPAKPRAPQRQ